MISQFFERGQVNVSTKYFYALPHNGSIEQMTDNSGNSVSDRSYDPFGRVTINSETVAPDFGFAGYYLHSRSGLNLTVYRAYSSSYGRFINRDPIEERGGINLFAYVDNNPVLTNDPSGLFAGAGSQPPIPLPPPKKPEDPNPPPPPEGPPPGNGGKNGNNGNGKNGDDKKGKPGDDCPCIPPYDVFGFFCYDWCYVMCKTPFGYLSCISACQAHFPWLPKTPPKPPKP